MTQKPPVGSAEYIMGEAFSRYPLPTPEQLYQGGTVDLDTLSICVEQFKHHPLWLEAPSSIRDRIYSYQVKANDSFMDTKRDMSKHRTRDATMSLDPTSKLDDGKIDNEGTGGEVFLSLTVTDQPPILNHLSMSYTHRPEKGSIDLSYYFVAAQPHKDAFRALRENRSDMTERDYYAAFLAEVENSKLALTFQDTAFMTRTFDPDYIHSIRVAVPQFVNYVDPSKADSTPRYLQELYFPKQYPESVLYRSASTPKPFISANWNHVSLQDQSDTLLPIDMGSQNSPSLVNNRIFVDGAFPNNKGTPHVYHPVIIPFSSLSDEAKNYLMEATFTETGLRALNGFYNNAPAIKVPEDAKGSGYYSMEFTLDVLYYFLASANSLSPDKPTDIPYISPYRVNLDNLCHKPRIRQDLESWANVKAPADILQLPLFSTISFGLEDFRQLSPLFEDILARDELLLSGSETLSVGEMTLNTLRAHNQKAMFDMLATIVETAINGTMPFSYASTVATFAATLLTTEHVYEKACEANK